MTVESPKNPKKPHPVVEGLKMGGEIARGTYKTAKQVWHVMNHTAPGRVARNFIAPAVVTSTPLLAIGVPVGWSALGGIALSTVINLRWLLDPKKKKEDLKKDVPKDKPH